MLPWACIGLSWHSQVTPLYSWKCSSIVYANFDCVAYALVLKASPFNSQGYPVSFQLCRDTSDGENPPCQKKPSPPPSSGVQPWFAVAEVLLLYPDSNTTYRVMSFILSSYGFYLIRVYGFYLIRVYGFYLFFMVFPIRPAPLSYLLAPGGGGGGAFSPRVSTTLLTYEAKENINNFVYSKLLLWVSWE